MSGRKRSQRHVDNPRELQEQAEAYLDEIRSTVASELDRAASSLSMDELTDSAALSDDEEIVTLQQEARFLTSQASPGIAYATLSSLREQGYELAETTTKSGVEATFTQVESENDIVSVSFTDRDTDETDAYEEILDVYGDDDCIEFLDTLDYQLQQRGIEKLGGTDITPHQGGERESTQRTGARSRDRSRSGRQDDRS